MAGYSGTPLTKKLGIRDGLRVSLIGIPADVRADLQSALAGCSMVKDSKGPIDFVMLFAKSQTELKTKFARSAEQLAPAGMLWVSWPKRASGVPTDMNENDVRRIGLARGLVDVKVCAVSEVWAGLKFVRRVKDR
jgi:hypothetical protein